MENEKVDYVAAEEFYTNWIEKEEVNFTVAKKALETYTAKLNEAMKESKWDLLNELGFKVSSEANKVSFSSSQIAYYEAQLKIIEDKMFDDAHPGHESK